MADGMIGVLIVDDSAFFRESLKRSLEAEPGIRVVGEAADAEEAVRRIEALRPDVVSLDVEMPGMSGIEFLRRIMPQYTIPVVVVSSVSGAVFDALGAGALDFVAKPDAGSAEEAAQFFAELKAKLKAASHANRSVLVRNADRGHPDRNTRCAPVLAFGASTGGTEALYTILKDLPHSMPGIVAVLHMPPVFTRLYAERLADICRMDVREAEDGMHIRPGRVLIAPGDRHLRIARGIGGLTASLASGERVNGHCPSVDVLFDSVAQTAGSEAVGVILTGMGSDGARGMLHLREAGALTLAQDEASSVLYGMPRAALELGAVDRQLSLERMASTLVHWAEKAGWR